MRIHSFTNLPPLHENFYVDVISKLKMLPFTSMPFTARDFPGGDNITLVSETPPALKEGIHDLLNSLKREVDHETMTRLYHSARRGYIALKLLSYQDPKETAAIASRFNATYPQGVTFPPFTTLTLKQAGDVHPYFANPKQEYWFRAGTYGHTVFERDT